jgi:serine/threonine protein kinase
MGIAVNSDDGTTGIVMELMQASLHDVIYEPSFEPYAKWDSAYLAIASDVSKGMAHIHFNGFLHRDLKPANILLDAQWVAKVADFGNTLDDSQMLYEHEQEIAGTPPYMAPEIITLHHYERPVDVWAFGCVLAHMGSRKIPYEQLNLTSRIQMLNVIRSGTCSPLELLFETLNEKQNEKNKPLKSIIELAKMCCQPDPSARPDFSTVANTITGIIGVDASGVDAQDPRPLVRIKNRKVVSFNAGKKLFSMDPAGSDRRGDSMAPSFMHSTYKDKFKEKGKTAGAAAEAGTSATEESADSGGSFLDTFSSTLLKTFTPGKETTVGAGSDDADKDGDWV